MYVMCVLCLWVYARLRDCRQCLWRGGSGTVGSLVVERERRGWFWPLQMGALRRTPTVSHPVLSSESMEGACGDGIYLGLTSA